MDANTLRYTQLVRHTTTTFAEVYRKVLAFIVITDSSLDTGRGPIHLNSYIIIRKILMSISGTVRIPTVLA